VLPGLGPRRAEALARRELGTVNDLLFYLPSSYDDRRSLVTVDQLQVGARATFTARVLGCAFGTWRGRGARRGGRLFEAVVGDDTGTVNLKWFRGGDTIQHTVKKGALILVTGDVKRYRFSLELAHPEVDLIEEPEGACAEEGDDAGSDPADAPVEVASEHPRRVVPNYSTPDGLNPRGLRRAIQRAVAEYADLVVGHLPEDFVRAHKLPGPAEALLALHAPPQDVDAEALCERRTPYHARLILEELFLLEIGLALRHSRVAARPGVAIDLVPGKQDAILRSLPFELTGAQARAWGEIRGDLSRPHPMNRLLEGDVGSGKTVIAYLAAAAAAAGGHQTALMAPTELLAEQHLRTLQQLATGRGIGGLCVELLTASQGRTHGDAVRAGLREGSVDLLVGTHALLQEGVDFRSLALVVVDEQHRFGVQQRALLSGKGPGQTRPHTLVMTATPIPRPLALTLHGDLDLSIIDELPPGRRPVETLLVREGEGRQVADLLRRTVERGEQAYVVYPLIDESEKSDLRAASESADRIRAAFPSFEVDLVHGRLDAGSRQEAMARFERGETQVLVSTTVIEVGVDIPNATLMIVEHAERFGLAQLHQLRGRIGRGGKAGTCVLVARGSTADSEARLAALLGTTDGFQIAEADLKIRGPGEFLGTRQHGRLPDLRIADLTRDVKLLALAREAALAYVRSDPELRRSPALARAVKARWGERLALSGVG
jgi:ATP-dependent DNA helicase RecG